MNGLRIPFPTYLNREIIRTKAEVVPSTKRGMLRSQVHLNMLEEIVVLMEETESVSKKEVISTVGLCFPQQSTDGTSSFQKPGSHYTVQSGLQLEIIWTVAYCVLALCAIIPNSKSLTLAKQTCPMRHQSQLIVPGLWIAALRLWAQNISPYIHHGIKDLPQRTQDSVS